jgi:hypothetical protein
MARCLTNLKQQGIAAATYAAEFKDKIATFSARPGNWTSTYSDLQNPVDYLDGAVKQMCDIVRRRSDRLQSETPVIQMFIPHVRCSHLVLQDYLSQQLPDPVVVCPEDKDRTAWGRDPRGYDAGLYTPNYGTGGGQNWRFPYGSSYSLTMSAIDKNLRGYRNSSAFSSGVLVWGGAKLGDRRMSEVAYPSSKVYLFEHYGRHFKKTFDASTYFGFPTARCSVLMFDTSVQVRASRDANLGCEPNSMTAYPITYNPTPGTPDPISTSGALSNAYYWYTRSGLQGIDFGGKEVNNPTQY